MDPDWDTDLNSRSYGIFIQTLATPRHVSNGLTKMVGPWSAGFLEVPIVLPGVYSVIVPLPSVVVVVVVVSETWAHANGAATAKAILSSTCFIVLSFFISFREGRTFPLRSSLDFGKDAPACYIV